MSPTASPLEAELTGIARIATVVAVMLAMMLEIIDMTVVNVSLPHIMGSFGATTDQVTWVVTSYMVSAAVVMPLTGYLSQRLGRRRLLLLNIGGFMAASAACGAAQSLEQLVLFRILQGVAGATMAPLAQSTIMSSFSREKRGSGMAIWGLGMMVAPVMGPTIGGYITEALNWRWIFYINIPVGLFALLLASAFIPGAPGVRARTDWKGLVLLICTVGSLQLMLDLGHSKDWFHSVTIQILTVAAIIGGLAFTSHTWGRPGAIVNLAVYKDLNFSSASLLVAGFGMSVFGIMTILPLMVQNVMGYPADVAGLIMAPRGMAVAVSMFVIGRIINKVDPRALMFIGAMTIAGGTFIYVLLPIDTSPGWIVIPSIVQGFGMGLFFIPSATIAYETLPRHMMDGAAGLFSLVRSVGGSVGIAIMSTVIAQRGEYHWQVLREHITAYNPELHSWLGEQGMTLSDPMAGPRIVGEVMMQTQMLAFGDAFMSMSLVIALLAVVILFMRHPNRASGSGSGSLI